MTEGSQEGKNCKRKRREEERPGGEIRKKKMKERTRGGTGK